MEEKIWSDKRENIKLNIRYNKKTFQCFPKTVRNYWAWKHLRLVEPKECFPLTILSSMPYQRSRASGPRSLSTKARKDSRNWHQTSPDSQEVFNVSCLQKLTSLGRRSIARKKRSRNISRNDSSLSQTACKLRIELLTICHDKQLTPSSSKIL